MRDRLIAAMLGAGAGALSAGFTTYMSTPARLTAIESTLFEHGILLQQILSHLLGD